MISTQWTADVINDKEKKESFEEYLKNNQRLLIRLNEIITEKEQTVLNQEAKVSYYRDNASWAYEQAHYNGLMAAYKEIKQLINL